MDLYGLIAIGIALVEFVFLYKLKDIVKVWFTLKKSKGILGIRISKSRTIDFDVLTEDAQGGGRYLSMNHGDTLIKDVKNVGLATFMDRVPTIVYVEGKLEALPVFDENVQKAGWDASKVGKMVDLAYAMGIVKGSSEMESLVRQIKQIAIVAVLAGIGAILINFYSVNQIQGFIQTMTQQIMQKIPSVVS